MRVTYRRQASDDATTTVEIVPHPEHAGVYRITVGERVFVLPEQAVHHLAYYKEAGVLTLQHAGVVYRLFDASQRRRPVAPPGGDLRAPMAGKVIRLLVQPGDDVTAGTPLLILEAMKMEHQILAPQAGRVTRFLCREGEQVAAGMELVEVAPDTQERTPDGRTS